MIRSKLKKRRKNIRKLFLSKIVSREIYKIRILKLKFRVIRKEFFTKRKILNLTSSIKSSLLLMEIVHFPSSRNFWEIIKRRSNNTIDLSTPSKKPIKSIPIGNISKNC